MAERGAELRRLFTQYTHGDDNIGRHLTEMAVRRSRHEPLLVSTGTDVVLFPGNGAAPVVESFRLTTRGFVEMAGISHLGPALGAIVTMAVEQPDDTPWREDAETMVAQLDRVRSENGPDLWRDVGAEAWQTHVDQIADMVDYACALTSSFLRRLRGDDSLRTVEALRREVLEAEPVPLDHVMVATFALAALDAGERMIRWLRAQRVDWADAQVLITGQAGRATAGLTLETNNMAHLLVVASDGELDPGRIYIAPSVPAFDSGRPSDSVEWVAVESDSRNLWSNVRVNSELAARMFDRYPASRPATPPTPVITPDTETIEHMPAPRSPDDMFTWVARVRRALEDSRELLSNCVANIVVDLLHEAGNRPADVFIPGLTGTAYPPRGSR